jgi:hypothetical protein
MARAMSSLPVPVSPTISTGASVKATRSISSNTWRIADDRPTTPWKSPPGAHSGARASSSATRIRRLPQGCVIVLRPEGCDGS